MTATAKPSTKRVRASDHAFRIALKVVMDAGLPVEKVLISGGQIEIRCGGVEEPAPTKNDGGPEDW